MKKSDKTFSTSGVRRSSRHRHIDAGKLLDAETPFAIREAYVQLRTNLMFSVAADENKGGRIFAVTSSNPEEGKSLTASNLAISFAMMGKKTLLIDCDMRKPTIHKLWNVELTGGVSNLLAEVGETSFHTVSEIPLTVLSAGDVPPNPSELLTSARFGTMLENFRAEYEYIIIDTPPVNRVADAQIIARRADGTLIVVNSGKTQKYELMQTLETLKKSETKVCGIVVNRVNAKMAKKSGYYKNYRYDYYAYKDYSEK